MINKVFDDPSSIARSGTASFRSQYLDSIPFDLDATKSFLVGDLPARRSMFSSQIWHVIYKLYPESIAPPNLRPLAFRDYRGLSLKDSDSLLGGMIISFVSLALGSILIYDQLPHGFIDKSMVTVSTWTIVILSIFSGIEPARRSIGRIFSIYRRIMTQIFTGSPR
jgi:septum site-determining protein MinD